MYSCRRRRPGETHAHPLTSASSRRENPGRAEGGRAQSCWKESGSSCYLRRFFRGDREIRGKRKATGGRKKFGDYAGT